MLAPLLTRGWVESEFGPTGGYLVQPLARDASLLELIELVEGPVTDGRCVLRDVVCPAPEPCALHDAWLAARGALLEQLRTTPVIATETATLRRIPERT